MSWEGQSVNPDAFSRLQETGLPVQPSNPCTLAGSRVIPLEKFPIGLTIGTVDHSREKPTIPLTAEQRDVLMAENNLSASVPFGRDPSKHVLMVSECGFSNMQNKPPVLVETPLPSFYTQAGPQGDQALMTPAQRREMMEFDAKHLKGYKYVKHAIADRVHTKKIMAGPQFHRGIVGVDANDNVESEIYGPHAQKTEAEMRKQIDHLNARRDVLAHRIGSIEVNGNIVVPESVSGHVPVNSMFQSKGARGGLTLDQTKANLFPKPLPASSNAVLRAQHLRDEDIAGRSYNFINHTKITEWPSQAPQRLDQRMLHPSQTALEGRRNMQGSLNHY